MGYKKVLFVCGENVSRSPMAAGLFQKILSDRFGEGENGVDIASAGIRAIPGKAAESFAKFIVEGEGVDISQHRSTPLTQELVQAYELILAMAGEIKEEITRSYPASNGKVYTIEEFSGLPDGGGVPDPMGLGLEIYQNCASRITRYLEGMVEKHYES